MQVIPILWKIKEIQEMHLIIYKSKIFLKFKIQLIQKQLAFTIKDCIIKHFTHLGQNTQISLLVSRKLKKILYLQDRLKVREIDNMHLYWIRILMISKVIYLIRISKKAKFLKRLQMLWWMITQKILASPFLLQVYSKFQARHLIYKINL